MTVLIPKLQQIQPSSSTPKNDRINLQVRDQASNIQNRTNQIVNLGNEALKVNKQYEDDKIDTLSSEANHEYDKWSVQKLQELKNHKGDPTDAYAQYDLDEKEFFDEMRDSRPNLNQRVRRGVEGKLAKNQQSQRIRVLKQRGLQKEVYEHKLFEADVKLDKKNLSNDIAYYDPKDATTTFPFDSGLINLKEKIVKRGIKQGTAEVVDDPDSPANYTYTNEDGEEVRVKVSDAVTNMVNKETSEGVYEALNTMIASGELDKAKSLNNKYAPHLNSTQRTRINTKLGKENVKKQASEKLDSFGRLDDEEINAKISNEKDGEVRDKMETIQNNRVRRRNFRIEQRSNMNYESILDSIEAKGITSFGELEDQNFFNQREQHLTAKAKINIRKHLDAPTTSKDKDIQRVQERLFKDNFKGMDKVKFSQLISPLSRTHRNRYRRVYEKTNSPSSSGSSSASLSARINFGNKLIDDKLLSSKDFKLSGKTLNKKSRNLKAKVRAEYVDYITSFETLPTQQEITKHIEPFIAKLRAEEILNEKSSSFTERIASFGQSISSFINDDVEEIDKFRKKPKSKQDKLKDLQSQIDSQLNKQ